MATTNLGRIALVPKGTYVSGTTYKMLDIVRYGTGSFVCLTLTTADPTDTSAWQLLASDGPQGIAGAGASNFTTQTKIYNFVGPINSMVGTVRFYPPQTITVSSIYMAIGVTSSSNTVAAIKKNGTAVGSVTLNANSSKSLPVAVSIVVTPSDYLTVDITSALGGQNLNITLVYS